MDWAEETVQLWKESLAEFHPDVLNEAFREYVNTSPYPPKVPAEVVQLCEAIRERRNHERAVVDRERERQELQRRRDQGEQFFGLGDLLDYAKSKQVEHAETGEPEPKFCVREMSQNEYDSRQAVLKRQAEIAKEKFGA
jgi:hypothetical protein